MVSGASTFQKLSFQKLFLDYLGQITQLCNRSAKIFVSSMLVIWLKVECKAAKKGNTHAAPKTRTEHRLSLNV